VKSNSNNTVKKIIYVDMDNVLVDFPSAFQHIAPDVLEAYADDKDEIDGIFALMKPMSGATDAYNALCKQYDVYILSTAPWENPSAWSDKLNWVKVHLGEAAYKRVILSHNKHLNTGDYLIDDRTANGADRFTGEHIHFGTAKFPDWRSVLDYLGCKSSCQ
jgi:5'(3')-deoxyribonucleotidase